MSPTSGCRCYFTNTTNPVESEERSDAIDIMSLKSWFSDCNVERSWTHLLCALYRTRIVRCICERKNNDSKKCKTRKPCTKNEEAKKRYPKDSPKLGFALVPHTTLTRTCKNPPSPCRALVPIMTLFSQRPSSYSSTSSSLISMITGPCSGAGHFLLGFDVWPTVYCCVLDAAAAPAVAYLLQKRTRSKVNPRDRR